MTSGIIIRLQNLPWTANAEDIRRYFDTLTIPDGGVHIIGGERGDAFIVFGSDEDARQAMLKDGGIIKDTPIKLLLSSRTEMQKVIEAAKQQAATQQAVTSQNFLQTLAAATQQFNPALQMPMLPQLMSMFPALRNFAGAGVPGMPNMPAMPGLAGMPTMPPFPTIPGVSGIPGMPGMPTMPGMPMSIPANMMPAANATNGDKNSAHANMSAMMTSLPNMGEKISPAVTSCAPVIQTSVPMVQHQHAANDKVGVANQQRGKNESKGGVQVNQHEKEHKKSRSRSRSRSRERRRDRYGRDAKRDRSRERKYRRSRSRDRYRKRSNSKERTGRDVDRTRDRNTTSTKDRRGSDSAKIESRRTSSDKDMKTKKGAEIVPSAATYVEENGYNQQRMKASRFEPAENRDVVVTSVTRNYETNKEEVYGEEESRKPAANRYEDGLYNNRRYPRNMYDEENNRNAYGSSDSNPYPRKNPYKPNYNQTSDYNSYKSHEIYKNHDATPPVFNSHASPNVPPAVNSYTGQNTSSYDVPSTCVELRNVPWTTTEPDIKKFFLPIPIYNDCIKFRNNQSNRERTVLVKFAYIDQMKQALLKSGNTISGEHVLVSEVSMTVWDTTEKCAPVIPRPQAPYVKISFIPKRANRDNIAAIFEHPPEQLIVSKVKNRESLVAYAKCVSLDDVQTLLLNKANTLICDSRVKVEPIQEADFQAGQRDVIDPNTAAPEEEATPSYSIEYPPKRPRIEQPPSSHPLNDRYHYRRPPQQQNSGSSSPTAIKSTCCLLKNLPSSVTDKEIVDFFADINVLPTQIHIMFNANYKQTGESYCEFRSEADAETALAKNGKFLRARPIAILLIPKEEVTKAIGVPKLTPMLPHENAATDETRHEGKVDEEDAPNETKSDENGDVTEQDSVNATSTDRPSKLPSLFSQPMKPPSSVKSTSYNGEYTKPPYRSRSAPYPPRHAPMRRPLHGGPGSVVMLENVPYRAEVEEILDFFSGYNIGEEQVLRRYNDYDQPTGDCRVSLRSPYEAQQAARTLNGCMIGGRSIGVSVVYE